jgi:hypothetical protein
MRDIFVTTYLATNLGIQAATSNLPRASETIGGWIGAEVRTTECAAQDKLAFVDGVVTHVDEL